MRLPHPDFRTLSALYLVRMQSPHPDFRTRLVGSISCAPHSKGDLYCLPFTLLLLVAHHAGNRAEGVGLVAVAIGEFSEEGEVGILGQFNGGDPVAPLTARLHGFPA